MLKRAGAERADAVERADHAVAIVESLRTEVHGLEAELDGADAEIESLKVAEETRAREQQIEREANKGMVSRLEAEGMRLKTEVEMNLKGELQEKYKNFIRFLSF